MSLNGVQLHGFLVAALLCGAHATAEASVFALGQADDAYPLRRMVRYGFTVRNTTNRSVAGGELWADAPVLLTSAQKCLRIETSHPCELSADELGNQVLHFQLDTVAPHGTKVVTVTADLAFSASSQPFGGADTARFLAPGPAVESDHPEIVRVAGELHKGTQPETAENIFRWVVRNVKDSGYCKQNRGALYALRQRAGDCTEFMDLFVAMCRASGIPARGMAGYVSSGNAVLKPVDYHNWAEFYQDGSWKLADPQQNMFVRGQSDYVATRILGATGVSGSDEDRAYRVAGTGLSVVANER